MDPLIVLLIVVTIVLTILLVVVGVQVVLILREVKFTLEKMNQSVTKVDQLLQHLNQPVAGAASMMVGLQNSLKLFEVFVGWVKEHYQPDKKDKSLKG